MKDFRKRLKEFVVKKKEGLEIGDYVVVRTYSAGVFAGKLAHRKGKEVHLWNARRLWRWSGAASLSQLSQEGVAFPEKCQFPCEVPVVFLTEAIEIIPATERARLSIASVPVWEIKHDRLQ